MHRRYLFLTLFLTIGSYCAAQSLSRSVVAIMGETSSSSGYSLSQTLGEAASGTSFANLWFITQGFQQPMLMNPIDPVISPLDAIDVYPNPVTGLLTISFRIKDLTTYIVEVYDAKGSRIISKKYVGLASQDKFLDFSNFKQGLYLVHVYSPNLKMDRVFKIEKM